MFPPIICIVRTVREEIPTRYKIPDRAFPHTCWSLVDAACGKDGKEADPAALQQFCVSYWYPLYAWARQAGHKAEEAEDLIQSFFERLIRKDFLAAADEGRGKLRSFLIACLKRHAGDLRDRDHAAKRDERKTISLDFEWAALRFSKHADPAISPDAMYDRRWAHALLHYVLEKLRESMADAGKEQLFRELRPYLEYQTNEEESYAELSARLGISEEALKSRIHRLRREYRKILLDQVTMTLEEGEDPKHELIELLGAM